MVDFSMESFKDYPDLYSVKLNGQEVGQHITELNLNMKAGRFPELTIKVNAEKLSLHSRCVFELPEPYKGLYEAYEDFYEACRDEFKGREKTPDQGV